MSDQKKKTSKKHKKNKGSQKHDVMWGENTADKDEFDDSDEEAMDFSFPSMKETENAEMDSDGQKKDSADAGDELKQREEMIRESGQVILKNKGRKYCIHLISIIGEVEGHECLGSNSKTTKYEHILPQLAAIEDSTEVDGVLILLNTMGGDVEAGLAIAEMIASISKPTVSLVLGGSHSIGVPIAVSTDYSFIVPSATMVIHPVRLNGMVIGVQQTFDYFRKIQDRILNFITAHCQADKERLEELMMETEILTKDVGTILIGKEAVEESIIDEVGGIHEAFRKLYSMIEDDKKES